MDLLLVNAAVGAAVLGSATWAVLVYRRRAHRRAYVVVLLAVLSCVLACYYLPAVPMALFGCRIWGLLLVPLLAVPVTQLLFLPVLAIANAVRRVLYTAVLGLVLCYLLVTRVELLLVDYAAMSGTADADGICRQSTSFTCGPAAVVMALHLCGVARSEGEVAARCRSTWNNGTNRFLVCAYLRRVLAPHGYRVELRTGAARRPQPPYLEVVEFDWSSDHWIVVVAADAEGYRIRDPLRGEIRMDRTVHEARSRNRFVAVLPAGSP